MVDVAGHSLEGDEEHYMSQGALWKVIVLDKVPDNKVDPVTKPLILDRFGINLHEGRHVILYRKYHKDPIFNSRINESAFLLH